MIKEESDLPWLSHNPTDLGHSLDILRSLHDPPLQNQYFSYLQPDIRQMLQIRQQESNLDKAPSSQRGVEYQIPPRWAAPSKPKSLA